MAKKVRFAILSIIALFLAPLVLSSISGQAQSNNYNLYIETPSEITSSDTYTVYIGQTDSAGLTQSPLYNVYIDFDSEQPLGVAVQIPSGGGLFLCFTKLKHYFVNGEKRSVQNGFIRMDAEEGRITKLRLVIENNCVLNDISFSETIDELVSTDKKFYNFQDKIIDFNVDARFNLFGLTQKTQGIIFLGKTPFPIQVIAVKGLLFYVSVGMISISMAFVVFIFVRAKGG